VKFNLAVNIMMNTYNRIGIDKESLIGMLSNENGVARGKARELLVALGKPAVNSLIQTLQHAKVVHVRWEGAKALGAVSDIRSIEPLINALSDSDTDVAWLAAEALVSFGIAAWPSLLQLLVDKGSDAVSLHKSLHHIFLNQKMDGLNDLLANLKKALEPGAVPESATVAAYEILKLIKSPS